MSCEVKPQNSTVSIECLGRGPDGKEVLDVPVTVDIGFHGFQGRSSVIVEVTPQNCPHNTGGHAERCKASHPEVNKLGEGVFCPFSFDWPHCVMSNSDWKGPEVLMDELERLIKACNA